MLVVPTMPPSAKATAAGFAMRGRVAQAEAAEERATQAEREHEAAARVAVAEVRMRIARELHDIVAHAVSVMMLQVGAVRHNLPEVLGEEKGALSGVEKTGREALAPMRRLLGARTRTVQTWNWRPSQVSAALTH
jgi:signal transduction histidine kinase